MSLDVGVIGVGYLGRHHARIYSGLEGVRLVGVCDTDPERAGELARQYSARAFSDYRELLPEVQALSIATPTDTHFDIALECLKAGKDVLVEKPITESVAQADRLIEEAGRTGLIVQVGHLERFNPAVMALKGLIDEPVFFESERLSPFMERAIGMDVTTDLMIHDIDIVMSIIGGLDGGEAEIVDMKVKGARVISDKCDVAKAWLEFRGETAALITASRLAPEKKRTLKVFQKNSYLVLDYQKMQITKYYRNEGGIATEEIEVQDKEPLREQLLSFTDCVGTRQTPVVTALDGRNALKVALDITERIEDAR